MADLLQERGTWLQTQREAHMAHDVVYSVRGRRVTVKATSGRRMVMVTDPATGISVEVESRDFLIRAALIRVDGAPVAPQVGDEIREPLANGTERGIYQVMDPGAGGVGACFEQSDADTLRIHTKLSEVEDL